MAPPSAIPELLAWLPLNWPPSIVRVARRLFPRTSEMAPPSLPVLFAKVVAVMVVGVPERLSAPPVPFSSTLPRNFDPEIDNVPNPTRTPPPPAPPPWSLLARKVSAARVRLAWVASIPPPPPLVSPWAIVSPSMVTFGKTGGVARVAGLMAKTPDLPPPSTLNRPDPGPRMFTS